MTDPPSAGAASDEDAPAERSKKKGRIKAMLMPLAGWLLAFTLSLDDVVIASFVSGPGATTLPMLIFSKVKLGVTPDINALATVIILFVSIGVIAAALMGRKKPD